jgi:mono/diheme cytochrome c family protein
MRPFIGGFVLALVLIVVAGYLAVIQGWIPARGDVKPGKLETWAAHKDLDVVIDREEPKEPYPYTSSTAGIIEGAQLYSEHCAICHGNADGNASIIAQGFAIHAPQFAKHGVDDDPAGETYWKIEHGIHWTAMPAFGNRLSESQIWNIAFFLKNGFDKLPPAADAAWHKPVPEPPASAGAEPTSAPNPTMTTMPTMAPSPSASSAPA